MSSLIRTVLVLERILCYFIQLCPFHLFSIILIGNPMKLVSLIDGVIEISIWDC